MGGGVMEPQIQYAKTSDGVSIAYWSIGEGEPLVYMPNVIWSHAQLEWQFPEMRRWYEKLATRHTLVRFDMRGTGLSQRTVADYSLETLQLDLQAVVERLGLERFALFAAINAAPVAIAYAARQPGRVSNLMLWCYAPNADMMGSRYASLQALQQVMDRDWETYTETRAGLEFGWSEGELAHRYATFLRECITPQMALRAYGAVEAFDVSSFLPRIASPTLVVHRQQLFFWGVEASRDLAAQIPGARLALVAGVSAAPFFGDVDGAIAVLDNFLGGRSAASPPDPPSSPSGTAIILFADIADSTALTERLGDAAFREKARELDESLRRAITSNGGTAIDGKLLGDGVLAVFGAAREAIACAQDMHRLAQSSPPPVGEGLGEGSYPLLLHVGIHAGDVIREEGNVYGGAVNIASRVASEAAAGETLVSGTVRDLARTSAGVSFEDRGEHELKGIEEPVRVWAVRWRE
ncbi:MAG: adenylate/guanylate cyclase domain-containing protein [Dehalococcoidia bacterium]